MKCNFYQQTGHLFVLLWDVGIRLQFGFRVQFWETLKRLCSLIVYSTVMLSVYAIGWALRLSVWALRFVPHVRLYVVDNVNEERRSTPTGRWVRY